MIRIMGPGDVADGVVINTTSRSQNWSKGLSPFFLGPSILSGAKNQVAKNVENAWQFTKVYPEHAKDDSPTKEYFKWARAGFQDGRAHRYPMGKGRKPLYSWWNGEKLSYIEARKAIYIPIYAEAVGKSKAFQQLKKVYEQEKDIWLWDFDGYNHRIFDFSWDDVINHEELKMGHAFVLAMMMEGYLHA